MKREIKFRAKGLRGDWRYGLLTHDEKIDDNYEWFISNDAGKPYAYAVNPDTIGQFTGLKATNGTEIYEGDIIRFDWFVSCVEWYEGSNCHAEVGDFQKVTDVVVFQDYQWTTEDNTYSLQMILLDPENEIEIEVIGNIYDNPELLTVRREEKINS